jgi:hypothetical protein
MKSLVETRSSFSSTVDIFEYRLSITRRKSNVCFCFALAEP